ncbi:hypothetical protein [Sporolactobacillus pectinivorans]|uniref:hypothetical protein n=1 Tax=Sporolactobacillus pectinivorans TaxID=1591408 RepID=UPI000C26B380|nr:hypothetical protein [Sporolactobacillus pectinivorans]
MAKFGEKKTIEIEGEKYTFQHPGIREAVKMRDRNKNATTGQLIEEKYYADIMSLVIVEPKVNWDYWNDHNGFNDVMGEAATFLNS